MTGICEDIFKAIHEGKWLSIEYNQETSYNNHPVDGVFGAYGKMTYNGIESNQPLIGSPACPIQLFKRFGGKNLFQYSHTAFTLSTW